MEPSFALSSLTRPDLPKTSISALNGIAIPDLASSELQGSNDYETLLKSSQQLRRHFNIEDPIADSGAGSDVRKDGGSGTTCGAIGGHSEETRSTQPVRQVANARERDRTHSVNSAFNALRGLIPTEPINRKLSKIETLRLACSYIAHLATILILSPEEAWADQPCVRHWSVYQAQVAVIHGDDPSSARKMGESSLQARSQGRTMDNCKTPICTFCLNCLKHKPTLMPSEAGLRNQHNPTMEVLPRNEYLQYNANCAILQ